MIYINMSCCLPSRYQSTAVIDPNLYLDFNDVMIVPKESRLTSRSQVNLEKEFVFDNKFHKSPIKWTGVPIISANMDTTGTFNVYRVLSRHKIITAMNKFYSVEDYTNALSDGLVLDPDYFMVSTGITDDNYKNLIKILETVDCKWICIDVANGYMSSFFDFCYKVRCAYPDKIIVAGNVVTPEMVNKLIVEAGVDIVKIGIGPGSACLTRMKTGVGVPQFSAIMNCNQKYIISDGGIKCPGDMAKAFGAGANFVMMGGVFAGHDENPGELIEENGEKYKLFYGMSSQHAMEKHYGKMNNYRSSEGAVLKLKYKGALENTVNDYLGGLRSACTYVNAINLDEFTQNVRFVKQNK